MTTSTRLTDTRNPLPVSTTATKASWQGAVHPHRRQPAAIRRRRRFNPVTVGFWLGGFVLGTAGAIAGACMPYRYPAAVTISVLWWCIYFGFFGASIGALLGLWKNRTHRLSK
jgi:hypothetical protein